MNEQVRSTIVRVHETLRPQKRLLSESLFDGAVARLPKSGVFLTVQGMVRVRSERARHCRCKVLVEQLSSDQDEVALPTCRRGPEETAQDDDWQEWLPVLAHFARFAHNRALYLKGNRSAHKKRADVDSANIVILRCSWGILLARGPERRNASMQAPTVDWRGMRPLRVSSLSGKAPSIAAWTILS